MTEGLQIPVSMSRREGDRSPAVGDLGHHQLCRSEQSFDRSAGDPAAVGAVAAADR